MSPGSLEPVAKDQILLTLDVACPLLTGHEKVLETIKRYCRSARTHGHLLYPIGCRLRGALKYGRIIQYSYCFQAIHGDILLGFWPVVVQKSQPSWGKD